MANTCWLLCTQFNGMKTLKHGLRNSEIIEENAERSDRQTQRSSLEELVLSFAFSLTYLLLFTCAYVYEPEQHCEYEKPTERRGKEKQNKKKLLTDRKKRRKEKDRQNK